jgi:CheY-like chemotaxis protein
MTVTPKRILLVDDCPRDIERLFDALPQKHLASDVVAVRDGAEALDYLFRRGRFTGRPPRPPAIVLLDLKIPKVDGMEVLRQMRSAPQLKMIPVVVMTSSREEQDVVNGCQFGVNACIVKPVQFQEFVDAVRQVGGCWAAVDKPPPPSVMRWRSDAPVNLAGCCDE